MTRLGVPFALVLGTAACGESAPVDEAAFAPVYEGIAVSALDEDLVSIVVSMRGARGVEDVDAYARCAAAGYAMAQGGGFARHLRTKVDKTAGLWRGDAVYTISTSLPRGFRKIDAEVTALACAENGIPTV